MQSQINDILSHLQSGKTITPIDALNLFGCFRLGARIFDLKKMGYNIETNIVHNGRKKFAEYKLLDEAQNEL